MSHQKDRINIPAAPDRYTCPQPSDKTFNVSLEPCGVTDVEFDCASIDEWIGKEKQCVCYFLGSKQAGDSISP